MRRLDDTPIDPEIAACLDAIDATLAGEPVDPRHAELAELALLLADERPQPRPQFASELDARATRRFAPAPGGAAVANARAGVGVGVGAGAGARRRRSRWWRGLTAGGLSGACVAALVLVVVMLSGGSSSPTRDPNSAQSPAAPTSKSSTASSASSAASGAAQSRGARSAQAPGAHELSAPSPIGRAAAVPSPAAQSSTTAGGQPLSLPSSGRKVIQSAELNLSTTPNRIDAVAQEVFNVVGEANGIVDRSAVTQTGGTDGSASFELRLPSSSLGQTLGRLSDLRGAQVLSRTDSSQDVNSQYVSVTRRLADDQAQRTSLLKQLAAAVTTRQISAIRAQLKNIEASIAADQAALRQLNSQIDYSRVTVTIAAGPTPVAVAHHSAGGFTLGHAVHIAGRVLVVAAGIGLILLAALVPLALVAAVLGWGRMALRRRRREQALDFA